MQQRASCRLLSAALFLIIDGHWGYEGSHRYHLPAFLWHCSGVVYVQSNSIDVLDVCLVVGTGNAEDERP